MRECDVEHKLVKATCAKHGMALKFISPGTAGVPDRIVLMPHGRMAFVEVKAPGQKLRPLQLRRKKQLEKLGYRVFVLDDKAKIDEILKQIGEVST